MESQRVRILVVKSSCRRIHVVWLVSNQKECLTWNQFLQIQSVQVLLLANMRNLFRPFTVSLCNTKIIKNIISWDIPLTKLSRLLIISSQSMMLIVIIYLIEGRSRSWFKILSCTWDRTTLLQNWKSSSLFIRWIRTMMENSVVRNFKMLLNEPIRFSIDFG